VAFNRGARRKNNNPYTSSGVEEKTISNVYNESFAKSIAYGGVIDESAIYVALQNNKTAITKNMHFPGTADRESPVRSIIQFDLENASSGIGEKEAVHQAVLFLKVKDVSPAWPGYSIDILELLDAGGTGPTEDATWNTATGSTPWNSAGITPQIGIGYSLTEDDNKPFSVDGYYPLYRSKQTAISNSPTPNSVRNETERARGLVGYHEHVLNGVTYYMPNGLVGRGQFHGTYNSPGPLRFNEYRSPELANKRAVQLGCIGHHTITRSGAKIYKPCRTPFSLLSTTDDITRRQINQKNAVSSSIPNITLQTGRADTAVSSNPVLTNETSSEMTVNGSPITNSSNEENPVDLRYNRLTIGGGTVRKNLAGEEIKLTRSIPRIVRKEQNIMIDVTSLVQNAVGRNYRYLSLLLKGSHARRESESNPNPTVGPQDQYVGFYSFKSGDDATVYKAEFNTTRNEVTGNMVVDLYTSDKNSNTTGAYIMRPQQGSKKLFNDFFKTASSGDTVTFQSGTIKINETSTVDIGNTTLTVEGYNKDYIQFENNPIAGYTPGTYNNITVKINKTTTVNELEIISSSTGDPTPPFKAFEPFVINYHGDSSGSNNSKTFTPTSIKRRDGNVLVTVKETVVDEQHVDHSGGLQFTNLANGPRLKVYYKTRRN